jgi:polyhydroxyalkanoate synthesis regulator phasin
MDNEITTKQYETLAKEHRDLYEPYLGEYYYSSDYSEDNKAKNRPWAEAKQYPGFLARPTHYRLTTPAPLSEQTETYEQLKERLSKIDNPIEREATEFATLNFDKGTSDSPFIAAYEGVLHGVQWIKSLSEKKQEAESHEKLSDAEVAAYENSKNYPDRNEAEYAFIDGVEWQSQHTAKELAESQKEWQKYSEAQEYALTEKNEHIEQLEARVTQLENMLKYARNGYSTLIEYEILNDRYKDDAQVIIDKIESIF